MVHMISEIEKKCINTIRVLSADIVQNAKSGHPGAPMGLAPLAHVLWSRFMKFDPSDPKWANRDRFVLSNGHACVLQYIMLHLLGYDLSLEDLKSFRQVDSRTPGHPEANHATPGIEVSTGPLGQGFANAVGMAMAGAHVAAIFNKPNLTPVDNYVYVIFGDGCSMEGITSEAASLAGHLGLPKLIAFYDANNVTIDGDVSLAFTEDVGARFLAYNWHVTEVKDGDTDLDGIEKSIRQAQSVMDRPSLIIIRTTIGFGSSNAGTEKVHGSPLGDDDVAKVKQKFDFDPKQFFVIPDEVKKFYQNIGKKSAKGHADWNELMVSYANAYPELASEFKRRISGRLPDDWKTCLPTYTESDQPKATRQLSSEVLNKLAVKIPELIGGSADLTPSNLTNLKNSHDFQKGHFDGRYFRFGVREHAMCAALNGMVSYGGVIPYVGTFLNFITYAWGAVRLTALTRFRGIFIMTHDSIGLGEDGPTHQPIETYSLCRSTPNLLFVRPADGNEVVGAYLIALENIHRPTVLSLTRQNVPNFKGSTKEKTLLGAYVLYETDATPKLILIGTGSEVSLCMEVSKLLEKENISIRVVSMPCWTLFDEQSLQYRSSVFPDGIPVLSVEAASTIGWQRYAHASIGIDTFGSSGPYKEVYKRFHLVGDDILLKAKEVICYYKTHPVPSIVHRPFLN